MKLTKQILNEMIEEIINEGNIRIPFLPLKWKADVLKQRVLHRGNAMMRQPEFAEQVENFFGNFAPDEEIALNQVFKKPGYKQKSDFSRWTPSSPNKYDSSKKTTYTLNFAREFSEVTETISLVVLDEVLSSNPELWDLHKWTQEFEKTEGSRLMPNTWKMPQVGFASLIHSAITNAMKNQWGARGLDDERGSMRWQLDKANKRIALAQQIRDSGGTYEDKDWRDHDETQ